MTKKIIYSLAILFTILFAVSSCKKDAGDKKADDDLASSVSGHYTINYFSYDGEGTELPKNGVSGTIEIANKDKTTADMLVEVTDTNNSSNSGSQTFEDVQLRKESSVIAFYYQNVKIGSSNNNQLEISVTEEGHEVIFKAKK